MPHISIGNLSWVFPIRPLVRRSRHWSGLWRNDGDCAWVRSLVGRLNVALLLLGPHLAPGQTLLRGKVRLPDSGGAAMALVKLLEADSTTMHRYVRADRAGEWSIEKVMPGQYVLQVAFLGLETWAQRVEVQAGPDTLFFDMTLQEKPFTL